VQLQCEDVGELLTTIRESLRAGAVTLNARHWVRWSWRRARGPLRYMNGTSLEAIVGVRAAGVAMALVSHSMFKASGKARQRPITRGQRSSHKLPTVDCYEKTSTHITRHVCTREGDTWVDVLLR
jgi:hypothetical protein